MTRTPGILPVFLLAVLALPGAVATGAARAENITLVSQLDPVAGNDQYGDVWGEGSYAYLGSFAARDVRIIDISNPSAPFLATTYSVPTGGQFKDVKVYGGIGYFASDNGGGLHIVDLSNPAVPSLLFQFTGAHGGFNSIHNVSVSGGYVFEADSRTATVKVIDVSNPASPFFVRNIVTPDTQFIHDITILGNRMYASGWSGYTYVYDITNIGSQVPVLLGQAASGFDSHSSAVTSDNTILVTCQEISDGEVRIFDVSNPASPVLLSTIDRDSLGIDAYSPHNPFLYGDSLLFVSWYQAGVQAFDISDPANPVRIGDYDTYPGVVSGFDGNWGVYAGLGLDRVLLSDLDGGLFVVNATTLVYQQIPVLGAPSGALLALILALAARRRLLPPARKG